MSVWILRVGYLSFGPSITVGSDWFLVETHVAARILGLFTYARSIRMDRRTRRIHLQRRRLFWTHRELISFDEIDFVTHEYESLPYAFGWRSGPGGRLRLARSDELQAFSVALVLKNGQRVLLARFFGEGAVETGWPGTLLGDTMIDLEGRQMDDSRSLLREVLRLTGAPLGISTQEQARLDDLLPQICPDCGQRNRREAQRCLYCGEALSS